MRKRNIKINIFLNKIEKKMLIEKFNKAKLSQFDFIRKLINDYTKDDVLNNNLEEKLQLLKIVGDLYLLKKQIDFLNYSDYSNFITKQIRNIHNIINQTQK